MKIQLKSDDEKIKTILNFYVLTNKLKNLLRKGWQVWGIEKERAESVAEHVFGTCMLAVSIWSETLPDVNLSEVILMLALHETEEIVIKDITPFDDENKLKLKQKGQMAVQKIFEDLIAKDIYFKLIQDFDAKSTKEAIFAHKCDKLECDLQARIYSDEGALKIKDSLPIKDKKLEEYRANGITDVADYFILFDREKHFKEDDLFNKISKYIQGKSILKHKTDNKDSK